jgi:hypothetical protein
LCKRATTSSKWAAVIETAASPESYGTPHSTAVVKLPTIITIAQSMTNNSESGDRNSRAASNTTPPRTMQRRDAIGGIEPTTGNAPINPGESAAAANDARPAPRISDRND